MTASKRGVCPICQRCANSCKQPAKVRVYKCPQFKAKEK